MKLFKVLALIAALGSTSFAGVVSSKESGKAHCSKMQADQTVVSSSASTAKSGAVSGVAR